MPMLSQAVFGGGCFWCTESVFQELRGVVSVMPGYAGGTSQRPTYEAVCSGRTGHAEAVRIVFDSAVVSYRDLLRVFFATHDPTTLNRQGNDVGTQYRSIVLYGSASQKSDAEAVAADVESSGAYGGRPVVTELKPLETFWEAEPYHRDYYAKNRGENAYCRLVIDPKMAEFRKTFGSLLKTAS